LIPLKYSLRNLWRRRTRTVLTAGGVALGVFAGLGMVAAASSLRTAIARNGDPDQVLLYSKAATQLELSAIDASLVETVAALSGVRTDARGQPLASPEIYAGTLVDIPDGPQDRLAVVRAVTPAAAAVHSRVRPEGGWPALTGRRALVGRLAATKLGVPEAALAPGRPLEFEGARWTVVGVFDAPGTTMESEIWVDLQDLRVAARREDLTHVVLVATDAAAARAIAGELPWRTDLRVLTGRTATDYYAAYATAMQPLAVLAALLAVLVGAGGGFAALNTMSANVSARIREIGTLRAIGYSGGAVVTAIAVESVALAVAGAAVGCAGVAAFSGLPVRMAMGAFRLEVGWPLVGIGLGIGAAIGLVGGVWPALRGLRPPIAQAVRAA